MVKDIRIREIYTNSLSCEPLLERCPNGELLCVCQCDGIKEPCPDNRVYAFHSKDDGETWEWERKPGQSYYTGESIYPEDGQAVYATELSVMGDEITAYLTVHSGRFLDWKCYMMKSTDNGYTWKNHGNPPFFPEYTFMRKTLVTRDGRILIPYQHYPVTKEAHDRVIETMGRGAHMTDCNPGCETGVIMSCDGGKTFEKFMAYKLDTTPYSEPTIAELSDGTIVMITREDGTGMIHRCDSKDGGRTWGEYTETDIPSPTNKSQLIMLDKGRIALIHTPSCINKETPGTVYGKRFPLELWISDDDMKTWSEKIRLTDFPGAYSYSDGFFEDGHIKFVIEHNRHTILFFDVTL